MWNFDHPKFRPYKQAAQEFVSVQTSLIATLHGRCGPGPASVVETAALQLAASRYLYARGIEDGDAKLIAMATRIGTESGRSLERALKLAELESPGRNEEPAHPPWVEAVDDEGGASVP